MSKRINKKGRGSSEEAAGIGEGESSSRDENSFQTVEVQIPKMDEHEYGIQDTHEEGSESSLQATAAATDYNQAPEQGPPSQHQPVAVRPPNDTVGVMNDVTGKMTRWTADWCRNDSSVFSRS